MKRRIILLPLMCWLVCACQNVEPSKKDETMGSYVLATADTTARKDRYVPMPQQPIVVNKSHKSKQLTGEAAINAANKKSIKQPTSSEYYNSTMNFNYVPGALYQIYCAPLSVTDVQFQNNEHIVAVGAGDTSRWQVTKSYSGVGANRQEHLFIKPMDEEITNSIVVTTDLRTYHLMLHSTNKTYMASVAWRYPDSDDGILKSFDDDQADDIGDLANSIDVNNLKFVYQIKLVKGSQPDWYPRVVFTDGKKTYIKFSGQMQEAPTLFVGTGNKNNQIVNYRVQGNYYIIDSVVYHAQLCSGPGNKTIVQITMKK